MNKEFKKSYEDLPLNEKRNQISNELILIGQLIQKIETIYGIPIVSNEKIKNYDVNKDANLTEEEMLSFLYEDVYQIEKELITILTVASSRLM